MAPKSENITDAAPPTSINPYEVLSIEKDATADQIKTAYRKAALKHHPDKATPEAKELAHVKFQEIAFAYAVLSDPHRRSRYDTTGSTAESLDIEDDDFNWSDFFRSQFKEVVSADAIKKFAEEYKGSGEEYEHLTQSYEKNEGDMDAIYEEVMLSNPLEDEERFREILDVAIEEGTIQSYPKYKKEDKRKRERRMKNAKNEAEEAMEYAKELGVDDKLFSKSTTKPRSGKGTGKDREDPEVDEAALLAIIQQRQKGRQANQADFLDQLASKYAPKKAGKRAREAMEEPPEEVFEKNNEKLKSMRANGGAGTASGGRSRKSKRTKN
ncbi:DnaJ-domain-containing protein [Aulographum hederae CBS 113979]|uniref:DnaJ-domain-containing protein n=1 Tax=Aulographum hederae CBS 113979 TaxID=1176131 RepID=A0A6G1GTY4_9PEZI|nr:DnaJ-domain-containing protein [Aulographum hederae CBS 113979]